MNEPIISPWIIYSIGVIADFKSLLVTLSVILMLVIVYFIINSILLRVKLNKVVTTIVIPLWCIFVTATTLTPDKNTLIAMYAANMVTHQNIKTLYQASGTVAKDMKQFTLDFLKEAVKVVNEGVVEDKKRGEK